jgi:hypothetical protein
MTVSTPTGKTQAPFSVAAAGWAIPKLSSAQSAIEAGMQRIKKLDFVAVMSFI